MTKIIGSFIIKVVEDLGRFLKQKRNVINLLIFGILILGLPIAVNLVQQPKIFFSRAQADAITFIATDTLKQQGGKWITTKPQVSFNLVSPFGPPLAASTSQSYLTPSQSYPTPGSTTTPSQPPLQTSSCPEIPDIAKGKTVPGGNYANNVYLNGASIWIPSNSNGLGYGWVLLSFLGTDAPAGVMARTWLNGNGYGCWLTAHGYQ